MKYQFWYVEKWISIVGEKILLQIVLIIIFEKSGFIHIIFYLLKKYWLFIMTYVFFSRNTFSKAGSMFLTISSNVYYKFWFTPSTKNGYLQRAQICFSFFFFFQISSKLNLFSCRDGVYLLSMVLSVSFDVKTMWGNLCSMRFWYFSI